MTTLRNGAQAPPNPFPVLTLRTGALFPGTAMTFGVGRPRSVALLSSVHPGDVLGVVAQIDPKVEDPSSSDLHRVGTYARVVQVQKAKEGRAWRVVLEGLGRFELRDVADQEPYLRVVGDFVADHRNDDPEALLLAEALLKEVRETTQATGGALQDLPPIGDDPALFGDRIAAGLGLDTTQAAELLGERDVPARLRTLIQRFTEARTRAELKNRIESEVREGIGKQQRDAILREQLKAIQKELGDGERGDEVQELRARLDAAGLPEEARKIADRELKRLESTGGQGPEANVIRTYLECLADLPWDRRSEVHEDLDAIAAKLDDDHSGLEEIKKRILEHIAVHKLSGNPRGTILCLVGPPGVGKTSLGRSIAEATGRKYERIALGGVRDEAEIRGHRRTYVGALPGRLVSSLRKAGTRNPVILLDEVDKLGHGWGGFPEAALLEVLDPEQNQHFTDHYLETPFDLSEVFFLCTANALDTISAPLRDRLEIVEITGYTQGEKQVIARRHLIPKRLGETGIPEGTLAIADDALEGIVGDYTREAGVRQLDREITRLARRVALDVARKTDDEPLHVTIGRGDLHAYLGKPRFRSDVAERVSVPGVATGLAWTPVGGDILFIETSRMPGKGRVEITGQLGDVMKESARAALSYVRSHAAELEVDLSRTDEEDLHIHVPAGAVPKDGPSAGVTMFTALTSLLADRRVRADTAMTGECTLRGRVLPVGGIKAKVLAAHRAGIRRVILPAENRRDLDEVPEEVRAEMEVIFVEDMSDALEAALEPREGERTAGAMVPGSAEGDAARAPL